MIPSNKWFAGSIQDRAAWFSNFAKQFGASGGVGAALGFTAAEITSVESDDAIIQFLANTVTELEAFKDAVRLYRIVITEAAVGEPTPVFPANPAFALPAPAVATGIFERLDELVKRIRVNPGYTPEIGGILQIIPSSPEPPPIGELKPVVTASESFNLYKFTVNVTRLGMPQYKVQIQRKGSSVWTDAAFATSNPCEVTVTPTIPGDPERVLVRAILMDKNAPVGQPSDPTFVTVNP